LFREQWHYANAITSLPDLPSFQTLIARGRRYGATLTGVATLRIARQDDLASLKPDDWLNITAHC
jgi:hypothetical protein